MVITTVISDLPDLRDSPFLQLALAAEVPLLTGNVESFSRPRGVRWRS